MYVNEEFTQTQSLKRIIVKSPTRAYVFHPSGDSPAHQNRISNVSMSSSTQLTILLKIRLLPRMPNIETLKFNNSSRTGKKGQRKVGGDLKQRVGLRRKQRSGNCTRGWLGLKLLLDVRYQGRYQGCLVPALSHLKPYSLPTEFGELSVSGGGFMRWRGIEN